MELASIGKSPLTLYHNVTSLNGKIDLPLSIQLPQNFPLFALAHILDSIQALGMVITPSLLVSLSDLVTLSSIASLPTLIPADPNIQILYSLLFWSPYVIAVLLLMPLFSLLCIIRG